MNTIEKFDKYVKEKTVKIAITGLSRSGKTVFITSLIDQLFYPEKIESVVKREFTAKLEMPNQEYQRFKYDKFVKLIKKEKIWDKEGTSDVTKTTIKLVRNTKKFFDGPKYVNIELLDYPGEWILDISMRDKSFDEWSNEIFTWLEQIDDPAAKQYVALVEKYVKKYDLLEKNDNDAKNIKSPFNKDIPMPSSEEEELHQTYVDLLKHLKKSGYSFLQPGRFIMPADMEDSPELVFSPIKRLKSPIYDNFRDRFIMYVQNIVREIHLANFVDFDRQIVLIDLLSAYKNGPAHYYDMKKSIETIMSLYDIKKQNMLMQWIHPAINKVVFVGTKADLISSSQRENYLDLLEEMVHKISRELKINNIDIATNVIAAVKTTQDGTTIKDGKEYEIVEGFTGQDKQEIRYYTGNLPSQVPSESEWKKTNIIIKPLLPYQSKEYKPEEAFDHINMDSLIKSLIGDYLI